MLIVTTKKGLDLEAPMAPSSVGLFTGRLFADVIRAALGVEVRTTLKLLSSCLLDVLPTDGFGKGSGGVETRMAVDCYELEMLVSIIPQRLPKRKKNADSLAAATAGLRREKMKGFFVNWWVKKFLGFSHVEWVPILDWLRAGLLEGMQVKPTGNGAMGVDLDMEPGLGMDLISSIDPVSGMDLVLGMDPGLYWDLGLDLDPELDLVLDLVLPVSSSTRVASLPLAFVDCPLSSDICGVFSDVFESLTAESIPIVPVPTLASDVPRALTAALTHAMVCPASSLSLVTADFGSKSYPGTPVAVSVSPARL
jgi:hypothetical protein